MSHRYSSSSRSFSSRNSLSARQRANRNPHILRWWEEEALHLKWGEEAAKAEVARSKALLETKLNTDSQGVETIEEHWLYGDPHLQAELRAGRVRIGVRKVAE